MTVKEEFVDIFDEEENILKTVLKETAIKENLLRRISDVFVFNPEGQLLIHKRAKAKKNYPAVWDLKVGGFVLSGEHPDKAAEREIKEEIGAENFELNFLFKCKFKAEKNNDIDHVYRLVYDSRIIPLPEEIEEFEWIDLKDIEKVISERKFIPNAIHLYNNHKEKIFGEKLI